jgi:hypothetical protein
MSRTCSEIKRGSSLFDIGGNFGRCRSRDGSQLDKPYDWLEFQVSVAVLSHAMLFIASLFAAPVGVADTAACQRAPYEHHRQTERAWEAAPDVSNVVTFGAFRTREVASLRVLGRCVLKAAPGDSQPVLFGSFTAQVDDSDDEVLARTRAEARAPVAYPVAVGAGRTAGHLPRAPLTQLERPPRV